MSFLFDSPEYRRRVDDAARQTPAVAPELGVLEQAGLGVMRGGASVARTVGLAAGGLTNLVDEGAGDAVFAFTDAYGTDARDFWTPDPHTTTRAGRIVSGLAEAFIPLALGGGSPLPLMSDLSFRTTESLAEQGVDTPTAVGAGLVDAMAVGLGFKLPMIGSTLARSLALGVAANPVLGGLAEGAQAALLNASGDEQAAQAFDPFDLERRSIELLLGLAFGGVGYAATRGARSAAPGAPGDTSPAMGRVDDSDAPAGSPVADAHVLGPRNPLGIDTDALLTYRAAAYAASRAPGFPVDRRAANAHDAAMREAIAAAAEGRDSAAAQLLGEAEFAVPPELVAAERARVEAARPAYEEAARAFDDYDDAVPAWRQEEAEFAGADIARAEAAIAADPDVTITLDDGRQMRASEALAQFDAELAEIRTVYPQAVEAAVTCLLRQL